MERRHLILDLGPMPEPAIGLPFRNATADDSEALAVLMLDAYEGTIDSDGTETIEVARDEVRGYLSGTPMLEHSFVALDGELPVAAALVSSHEGIPLIGYVMTAAAHKGRGLGTGLTQLALASLYAAGERQAHLWVTRGNTHAERIYNRLGFTDVPA